MSRQERLVKRKTQVTRWIGKRDVKGKVRKHHLKRIYLHKLDLLLEQEGLIDPPNSWHPDTIHDPGINANYRLGRTLNYGFDVMHFTVGTNSRDLIRTRGLCQFLYPHEGPAIQFAPDDAVCPHACEANPYGCGHEREALDWDKPLPTRDQVAWMGIIVRWRMDRKGLKPVHHPASMGRMPVTEFPVFHGFADHGGCQHKKCDQHTDGIQHPVMLAIFASDEPRKFQYSEDEMIYWYKALDGSHQAALVEGGFVTRDFAPKPLGAYDIPQAALDFSAGAILIKPRTAAEYGAAKKRAQKLV